MQELLNIDASAAPTYAANDPVNNTDPDGRSTRKFRVSTVVSQWYDDDGLMPDEYIPGLRPIKLGRIWVRSWFTITKAPRQGWKISDPSCQTQANYFPDGWYVSQGPTQHCSLNSNKNMLNVQGGAQFTNKIVCKVVTGNAHAAATVLALDTNYNMNGRGAASKATH